MKFRISAERLVDIVGLSCGLGAGVSVGFCGSPGDLPCAIAPQLIGNGTDSTPVLSPLFFFPLPTPPVFGFRGV